MPRFSLATVALTTAVMLLAVSTPRAGQISEGPTQLPRSGADTQVMLVNLPSEDIERNISIFRAAEEGGHLRLAGRVEEDAFLYLGPGGPGMLQAAGLSYALLCEDVSHYEIYLIGKNGVARSSLERYSEILSEGDSYYLVAAEPRAVLDIHLLQSKKRLPLPSEPGLPFEVRVAGSEKQAQAPLSYNPLIQGIVDQVSSSNLYSLMNDITGENSVTIGGDTYTINTRYSPEMMCRRAAQFIKEQFQGMGLEAEYDYFNFRTNMKSIIFPFDDQEGWAVGKRTTVIHTDDGGDLWVEDSYDDEGGLNDIAMWSRSHGCIAGNNGIIKVTDDGRTWQTVSSPTSYDLQSVAFIDSITVFCCGYNGTILRSVNGGDTWSSISSPTSYDLNHICFASPTVGWAVGENGRIIKTENGGSSWSIFSSPVSVNLYEVMFVDALKGWIAGDSGRILRTQDGETWQEMSTPVSDNLNSVFFLNPTVGWACGLAGTIIKSIDGGSSWSEVSLGVASDLNDVFFVSSAEGWVVGNGVVFQTINGGPDWVTRHDAVESGDVNVVATLPGTIRADEIYIICGHHDCISQMPSSYAPGADDNATGTIATIEAARVLKDYDFEATLKFVTFSREEQGLIGSGQYARQAYEEGDSIIAALNFDMIAYEDSHPEDIEILYNSISGWLANAYENAAALYVPGLGVNKGLRTYVGSDNSSFWDYGYPSFCGIEDSPLTNPQYHRTTDRVSTLDFDFYTDVVKGGVATLVELAVIDTVTSSIAHVFEPAWFRVRPNPGRGEISIEMSARGKRIGLLEIYDVTGRLVSKLEPSLADGKVRAVWQGEDDSGSPVGPGIYYIKSAGEKRATKIVLLK
ncbi:MAG: YCF48-related protein [Candidatus Eisenbacteria bacterium]